MQMLHTWNDVVHSCRWAPSVGRGVTLHMHAILGYLSKENTREWNRGRVLQFRHFSDLDVEVQNMSLPHFSIASPFVKWFGLATQISFIKFQLTIKGGPLHICTVTIYDPGKWSRCSAYQFSASNRLTARALCAVISEENMHPDSNTELDPSSSCSTASPGGDTPGCSQHPPDSLSSSVDSAEVEAGLIIQK